MAGFTYSTLTTAILNYTEVGTGVLSSTITDQFIDNSELRIQRDIPIDADRKEVVGNLVASKDNVYAPDHGLTNGSTYRFRGAPTVSDGSAGYGNPVSFDGIAGSNIAYASGYAITTGKYVSGSRDTDFTTDWFYFTVNTNTATAGSVKGGGFPVSVGPVTLSA